MVNEKREHFVQVGSNTPSANSSKRLPIVFCLDLSPSMKLHNRIEDLNLAIRTFYETMQNDVKALAVLEVAIVTFSSDIILRTEFEAIDSWRDLRFSPVDSGWTNLPEAVLTSIRMLEERVEEVKNGRFDPYLPFLVLVTDGDPDNLADKQEMQKAVEAVQSHCVASRGKNTHLIAPYIIGVGSDVRKETLDPFAERFTREAILINEPDSHSQTALFQEVFAFIGASVRDSLQGERDLGRLYERIRKNTVRKVSDMVYRVRGVL